MYAYEYEGESLPECGLADLMLRIGGIPAADGFGCSDCSCRTHLFRVDVDRTRHALDAAGMVHFAVKRFNSP